MLNVKFLLLVILGMIVTGLFIPLMGGWAIMPVVLIAIIWGALEAMKSGKAKDFFLILLPLAIGWLLQWALSLIPHYEKAQAVVEAVEDVVEAVLL